jgi:hypothetical protein
MRRATALPPIAVLVLVLALAFGGPAGLGRSGAAQDATPAPGPEVVVVVDFVPSIGHPDVGAWLLDNDDDPATAPALAVFHADGTYAEFDPADGSTGAGAWAATGPSTAVLTIVFVEAAEDGAAAGQATVRAEVEVAADGQGFVARYTLEFTAPDGTATGQHGPGTATATRIAAEGPGEPVGTFDDLSGQGRQEASPRCATATRSTPTRRRAWWRWKGWRRGATPSRRSCRRPGSRRPRARRWTSSRGAS